MVQKPVLAVLRLKPLAVRILTRAGSCPGPVGQFILGTVRPLAAPLPFLVVSWLNPEFRVALGRDSRSYHKELAL